MFSFSINKNSHPLSYCLLKTEKSQNSCVSKRTRDFWHETRARPAKGRRNANYTLEPIHQRAPLVSFAFLFLSSRTNRMGRGTRARIVVMIMTIIFVSRIHFSWLVVFIPVSSPRREMMANTRRRSWWTSGTGIERSVSKITRATNSLYINIEIKKIIESFFFFLKFTIGSKFVLAV